MRHILLATLILGCLVAFVSPQRGAFEFHDSHGRCWRCLPGSSCVRCPTNPRNPWSRIPEPWDRICGPPSIERCQEFPTAKFPSTNINQYYQCSPTGGYTEETCGCDTIFDIWRQECIPSDEIERISCSNYEVIDITPCITTTAAPPVTTTIPPVTTTLPVTTTAIPETTTSVSTKPPCVCVVWWPCWCNPCWNMPCHSCNGCTGMMG